MNLLVVLVLLFLAYPLGGALLIMARRDLTPFSIVGGLESICYGLALLYVSICVGVYLTASTEPRFLGGMIIALEIGAMLGIVWRVRQDPTRIARGDKRAWRIQLSGLLALGIGLLLLVVMPYRDYWVTPDIDSAPHEYVAVLAKYGGTYPVVLPYLNDASVRFTMPPGPPLLTAFFSSLVNVPIAQVFLSVGTVLYLLIVLRLAMRLWQRHSWVGVVPLVVAAALEPMAYLNYADGSLTRMPAELFAAGILLALSDERADESKVIAAVCGLELAAMGYTHHRAFALLVISLSVWSAYVLVRYRRLDTRIIILAGVSAILLAPFLISVFAQVGLTPNARFTTVISAVWAMDWKQLLIEPRFPLLVLALLVMATRTWSVPAMHLLIAFIGVTVPFLAPIYLALWMMPYGLYLTGFLVNLPIVLAAAGTTIWERLKRTKPMNARAWTVAAWLIAGAWLIGSLATHFYTLMFVAPGDYQALTWLRQHTTYQDTLVLNYALFELPDSPSYARSGEQEIHNADGQDRYYALGYDFVTHFVPVISERRAIFESTNRFGAGVFKWNVRGTPVDLGALDYAYFHPDEPGAEQVLRANGITHVYLATTTFAALKERYARASYLEQVFVSTTGREWLGWYPQASSLKTRLWERITVMWRTPPPPGDPQGRVAAIYQLRSR